MALKKLISHFLTVTVLNSATKRTDAAVLGGSEQSAEPQCMTDERCISSNHNHTKLISFRLSKGTGLFFKEAHLNAIFHSPVKHK